MKTMAHLVFMITLLLYNMQTSESPVTGSRLASLQWPIALPLVQGQFCPPHIAETQCECADKGRRVYVDCRFMGMSDVPAVFPPNTWQLDLSGNPIGKVRPDDLRNLDSLGEFICNNCQLEELPPESFRYNTKLQQIILNNNNLTHIDINLFQNLTDLRFVDLSNNTDFRQNSISALKKKYPKVKFSVDMDNSTSTKSDTTEASTETVEITTASDMISSETRTSLNTTIDLFGSTASEPSTSQPNTTLTHADKPLIKRNATAGSTWIILVAISVTCLAFYMLCVVLFMCVRKSQLCKQNSQETEHDLNNADSVSSLL